MPMSEAQRRWVQENPDRVRAHKRKYHEANKERLRDRAKTRSFSLDRPATKVCKHCSVEKPFTSEFFYAAIDHKYGLSVRCRVCRQKKMRLNALKRVYGLEEEHAKFLLTVTTCAICGSSSKLHVDHCHVTGVVRDMLCQGCNHGLGKFRDNPEFLRDAAEYLEVHAVGSRPHFCAVKKS